MGCLNHRVSYDRGVQRCSWVKIRPYNVFWKLFLSTVFLFWSNDGPSAAFCLFDTAVVTPCVWNQCAGSFICRRTKQWRRRNWNTFIFYIIINGFVGTNLDNFLEIFCFSFCQWTLRKSVHLKCSKWGWICVGGLHIQSSGDKDLFVFLSRYWHLEAPLLGPEWSETRYYIWR